LPLRPAARARRDRSALRAPCQCLWLELCLPRFLVVHDLRDVLNERRLSADDDIERRLEHGRRRVTAYRTCIQAHGGSFAAGSFFRRGAATAPTGTTTTGLDERRRAETCPLRRTAEALAACASLRPAGGFGFGGARGGFFNSTNPAFAKFESCLKQHGVQSASAASRASSAFRTALAACRSLLPAGGFGGGFRPRRPRWPRWRRGSERRYLREVPGLPEAARRQAGSGLAGAREAAGGARRLPQRAAQRRRWKRGWRDDDDERVVPRPHAPTARGASTRRASVHRAALRSPRRGARRFGKRGGAKAR